MCEIGTIRSRKAFLKCINMGYSRNRVTITVRKTKKQKNKRPKQAEAAKYNEMIKERTSTRQKILVDT